MRKILSFSLLAFLLLIGTNAWGASSTKTEGFETATAETTYNSTKNYTTAQSDCGIAWEIYYGCVSTDGKLAGSKCAQMRHYKSENTKYGYVMSKTPVYGLTNVSFKVKVSNTGEKVDVFYSTDGSSWTKIGSTHTFSNTNQTTISADVPSGGKYIKIAVSSSSSKPSGSSNKIIVDDIVFTYTTYTLTYSSTNGSISVKDPSGTTVTSGSSVGVGTPLTVVATGSVGYAFTSWTVTGDGSSVTSSSSASTTFTMGTANATLSAGFVEDNTDYTITCNSASYGSVEASSSTAKSGATVTLTTTPYFKYYTNTITVTDASSNNVPLTKTDENTYTFSQPASNVTASATFDNTYNDALDRELTERTGTSYGSWSGKSSASSAIYAGYSAGGNNSIQMKKASENSGIITTASGGYARKITVTWNTNTTDKRTLKIWGSNSAFNNIAGMTSGAELGEIKYGTSTELTISGDYQFIGMEGNGGAVYLDEIEIKWESVTTAIIPLTATDGTNYYATYSNPDAFVVPAGITVSTVGVSGDKITLTPYATGDIVKKNTGVLVSSSTSGNKTITLTSSAGTENAGNMLKPSGHEGIEDSEMASGCTFYKLAYSTSSMEASSLGFYYGAESGAAFDVVANKAYLEVPSGSGAPAHFLLFDEENNATNTKNIEAVEEGVKFIQNGKLFIKKNGVVYDMLGTTVK